MPEASLPAIGPGHVAQSAKMWLAGTSVCRAAVPSYWSFLCIVQPSISQPVLHVVQYHRPPHLGEAGAVRTAAGGEAEAKGHDPGQGQGPAAGPQLLWHPHGCQRRRRRHGLRLHHHHRQHHPARPPGAPLPSSGKPGMHRLTSYLERFLLLHATAGPIVFGAGPRGLLNELARVAKRAPQAH